MLTPNAVETIRAALTNAREMETVVACLDADHPRVVAIDKARAELDTLTAMQGGAWQPVFGYGDAIHIDAFNRQVWQWDIHERHGSDVSLSVDISGRSFAIDLPDNLRLCRFVPAEQTAAQPLDAPDGVVYSHRNGETEPPTVAGLYFLEFVNTNERGVQKVFAETINELAASVGQSHQWWGPIVPPWEAKSDGS